MRVLRKNRIEAVLERLSASADVYVPLLRGSGSGFFSWRTYDEDYDDLILDRLNVYMPPKQIIIAPTQKNQSILEESGAVTDKIIFGIRACDLEGINILDTWFADEGVSWSAYEMQRQRTVIVANACYHPAPTCFCTSVGVNPWQPDGADIVIRDTGKNGYIWEDCSEKGRALTSLISDLLEEQADLEPPTPLPFSKQVSFAGVSERLNNMPDHPLWEKHSEACQRCALCTYTCPTCYCLALQVESWRATGYEFVCYDSCAYQNEALISGMTTHREAATTRFKNRYMHKLQFYPQRYGRPLCTGCGRCIAICPADAGISRIIAEVVGAD